MSKQIIKQPDGLFCILCSVSDQIYNFNLNEEEVVEVFGNSERIRIENSVKGILKDLNAGLRPYYQFTHTFEEALGFIEEIHGKEYVESLKNIMKTACKEW